MAAKMASFGGAYAEQVNSVVWGKYGSTWWPAYLWDPREFLETRETRKQQKAFLKSKTAAYLALWLGPKRGLGLLSPAEVKSWAENHERFSAQTIKGKSQKSDFRDAVSEAMQQDGRPPHLRMEDFRDADRADRLLEAAVEKERRRRLKAARGARGAAPGGKNRIREEKNYIRDGKKSKSAGESSEEEEEEEASGGEEEPSDEEYEDEEEPARPKRRRTGGDGAARRKRSRPQNPHSLQSSMPGDAASASSKRERALNMAQAYVALRGGAEALRGGLKARKPSRASPKRPGTGSEKRPRGKLNKMKKREPRADPRALEASWRKAQFDRLSLEKPDEPRWKISQMVQAMAFRAEDVVAQTRETQERMIAAAPQRESWGQEGPRQRMERLGRKMVFAADQKDAKKLERIAKVLAQVRPMTAEMLKQSGVIKIVKTIEKAADGRMAEVIAELKGNLRRAIKAG